MPDRAPGGPASTRSIPVLSVDVPLRSDGLPSPHATPAVSAGRSDVQVPPAFAAFDAWVASYGAASADAKQKMLPRGMELAGARRKAMAGLIVSDPRAAVLLAATPAQRALLPQGILDQMERPLEGEGFYGVLAVCGEEETGLNRVERQVIMNGESFRANVYGKRARMKTVKDASLSGVALDGEVALHEDDAVIRPGSDMPPGLVPAGGFAISFKGQTIVVPDRPALESTISKLLKPVELPLAASGPTFDPETPPAGPAPPTEAYNEYTGTYSHQKGPKTVFVFLIEPSDGAAWASPPSFATLDAQLNTASQNYYNVSYRQTWFGPKYKNPGTGSEVLVPRLVVSPVIRLSKTTAELINAIGTQAFDAKALVEALGGDWTNNGPKDPDNFDRWVIMSNSKLVTSTGLAFVGGSIAWTNGALSGSVAEHEWGHNWGVVHANSWSVPQGAQPRAASGTSVEYNDGWDIMGGGSMTTGFNTLFQEDLGFLERSRGEVVDVTSSGTYRIYDYIDPYSRNPTSNARALLIPMSSFTDWKRIFLGFGHVSGTDGGTGRSDWNRNAITVHSGLSDGSNRIDTTPYSQQLTDANDSSVKIGRTYTEAANVNGAQMYGGFSVTPVQRGSTVVAGNTHEWMDVVVNYGTPSPNPPVASFPQSTYAAQVGGALALTVSASDPDGDALSYDWDFGDGTYSVTNSATQTKAWSAGGYYLVTCTVSDMKGRTATASCWVNAGQTASRAPDNPASTLAGFAYRYYEGTFTTMPDFATLLPVKTGTVSGPDISPRNRNDNFAFVFDGYIDIPATDVYTFRLTSDDGSRLYIGGTLVVDNNGVQSSAYTRSGNIALNAGKHRVRIEYFHKDGTEALGLEWSTLTSAFAAVPAGRILQTNPASNPPPAVAITNPAANSSFVVNSDILLQAEAADSDGISSVVFFADGAYLGTDTTAPYSFSWSRVSVGSKSVVALAYDAAGAWSQSAAVRVDVVSPSPQPSIGLNLNTEAVAGGSMFFNDVSGAVYQQSNWNNLTGLSGNVTTVKDHLGNTVAMPVSWVGTVNNNYGDGSSDADTSTGPGRMFKGLAEIRQDEAVRPSVTASNVPYPQYDVYVYFDLRGSDVKDTLPQRFVFTPTEGAAPADVFGKNSLSSTDAIGDYPTYDTWVGFKEATATSATASNDALLGNYVVFRKVRSSGFTVKAERQIAGTQQKLGINAVQIVRSEPDAPLVLVRHTNGATAVAEGGTGDAYTVVLGYMPDSSVTVTATPGAQLVISPSTLVFTPQNWNVPQTVNVSAVDDSAQEGAHAGTISHAVSASGNYNGASAPSLQVSISDDDQPSVSVQASGNPAEAAAPVAGRFQILRSGTSSLALPLSVAFQMNGTADPVSDYTLSGGNVTFSSANGTGSLTIPAGQAQVFLTLTPVNDSESESPEAAAITISPAGAYAVGNPASATLNIADNDAVDYFTELFDSAAAFDLNGRSLTFTPSGGGYSVSSSAVAAFPSGTSGFTSYGNATLSGGNMDDGFWTQTLASAFPFFGTSQATAYVGTNGYITFNTGDTSNFSSLSGHFSLTRPRISGLARDLNPGAGGSVSYKRDTTSGQQRSIFFWNGVRNYGQTDAVSFQIELFDDGRIRMTWLNSVLSGPAVTGLSSGIASTMPSSPYDGTGTSPFFESNLGSYSAAAANTVPAFASMPRVFATAGQPYSYAVACTDQENDALTISAVTKPSWLNLTPTGNGTATLSGTPGSAGTYAVLLQVSDGSASVQQSFSITAAAAGGNALPQFSSQPLLVASAGSLYSSVVTATDPDGQSLLISAAELPAWLTLTDSGNGTATLSGTVPDTGVQSHAVTLIASDRIGSVSQSFSITLNRAPVISLLSPSTGFVELPRAAIALVLEASAPDDGLPAGSSVSAAWTVVSGPGTVTFGSPAALKTSAVFSAAGNYIVRLTASDGTASSTRDVYVFVESDGDAVAASGMQGWWKFDEGTGTSAADSSGNNRTLTLTSASMSGDGYSGKAYTGDASAVQNAENATLAPPAQLTVSGWVFAVASPATSDRYLFNFHTTGNSRLRVYLASGTSRIRLFSDRSTDGVWEAQFDVPAYEWFHLAVAYDTSSAASVPVFYINGRAVTAVQVGSAPAGAQVASASFRVGGNAAASNSWLGRIDEVRLHNRIVPASQIPLLMLAGPVNSAPDVSAGPDGDTSVGSAFSLQGSVSDDGLPSPPGSVALQWSKLSGAGSAAFSDETSASASALFSGPGSYVLRLSADDGGVRVFDEVSVSAVSTGSTFDSWISGFPGIGSLNGLRDDPDGDGLPNLVEYALKDGHAANADARIAPSPGTAVVGANQYLTLTINKNPAATGVTYTVEVSPDLATWSSGPSHTTTVSDSADTLVVRDNTALGGAAQKRYIRLKITQP